MRMKFCPRWSDFQAREGNLSVGVLSFWYRRWGLAKKITVDLYLYLYLREKMARKADARMLGPRVKPYGPKRPRWSLCTVI